MFFFVNWSIYDEVQARLPKEQAIPSATRTVRQRIQYDHFSFPTEHLLTDHFVSTAFTPYNNLKKKWTPTELKRLERAIRLYGREHIKAIARCMSGPFRPSWSLPVVWAPLTPLRCRHKVWVFVYEQTQEPYQQKAYYRMVSSDPVIAHRDNSTIKMIASY